MGLVSKLIGLGFIGAGLLVWVVLGGTADVMVSYIWIFVGMLLMSIGISLITGGRNTKQQTPPPPTVTEIRCDNPECDFKEIRNYEEGDYILKALDAKCPRCGSSMTIQGVYVVKEDDSDKSPI
ncbi:MAG: hypothetical protein K9W43_08185 [Candidatus Thorarchaeota archaeon]|nr:hypothetical protein [Candidatus Thorarchaeota archaeon]